MSEPEDMTCTAVNVSGDLTACLVMERWVADAGTDSVASDTVPSAGTETG